MRKHAIETYLDDLAARTPAPGGGASAGVHVAQAAALLGMVARYSSGDTVAEIRDAADELRERALSLSEEDITAFGAVGAAYRLPRSSAEEERARSAAIAEALVGAGRVPAEVVAVAEAVVVLAERLLPVGNRNVVTDIAAAADAARAAATTARVNVEINLAGITGPAEREALARAIAVVDEIAARADRVTAAVRAVIAR
ncbi:cyclodeaminase/cyclohydrolase family protein [Amycolatopsis sp. 195334CR]|uniref:cyclodeaminase/cyclohydrolase family protein n=1 Tax=Amycolatopsis sp. 195334CR TaxID=2814588 RepID=UPI001A8C21A8|nr:cyclodeaminase/cyclohydrolase family protein [Amycolatopsis sp. 195334CR]MBN6039731.1 cyclodeaminase/cyclohydrolase family protein [Amycolatopsis sp. 195334CR]